MLYWGYSTCVDKGESMYMCVFKIISVRLVYMYLSVSVGMR